MIRTRIIFRVHRLFAAGSAISLTAMIAAVIIQVFARFFLEVTPHWTEEAARIFFIYAVAMGTGTGLSRGDFIRLDLLGKYLSPGSERALHIFTELVILIFSFILIISGYEFVLLGMAEKSPALQISMGLVFISMMIIGLAIFIFTLGNLYLYTRVKNEQK
jgi:TRAP-type transport system small permease protein